MIKIIDVDCPYTRQSQQISVDYCYVPVMRSLQKNYKKMSYECPMCDECPPDLKDQYGECSAYNNLPVVIHD